MKIINIDGVEYTLTPVKQEKELFIGELQGKRYYLGPEAENHSQRRGGQGHHRRGHSGYGCRRAAVFRP